MLYSSQLLGQVLKQAGLISEAQLEVALREQAEYCSLRIGEIFTLHGWLSQQTADFFAEQWPHLLREKPAKALGYYLQAAGLLSESQINTLLKEQWQTGVRLGALAVLRGWMKQSTLDFFLSYVAPAEMTQSPFAVKHKTLSADQEEQRASENNESNDVNPEWAHMRAKDLEDLRWLG